MVIIETTVFTRQVSKYLSAEEYQQLQIELINHPDMGVLIAGSGGIRKMRWGLREQGKRGGVRVVYYWAVSQEQILMLLIYPKNVQDDLSPGQLRLLRQIVEVEFP